MIAEHISRVDIVMELLDARIPRSSKNPDIDALAAGKHRIAILNKSDLADEKTNLLWRDHYTGQGFHVAMADSSTGKGFLDITKIAALLTEEKRARKRARGVIATTVRAMVLGIPNVGKSTFINKFAGRAIAKTADRPGITKAKQWIKINDSLELMDTPGILWPKFGDPDAGVKLAATGAIKDEILDIYSLSLKLVELVLRINPDALAQRYKIEIQPGDAPEAILQKIAQKRGFVQKGGALDTQRAAITLTDEFRSAKIGRISLEKP
jgi:ribosome biogenesis GTPase A